ncbi:hypothetical protein RchiOBHm_Chr4g0395631 [Rosa chinensis]|uniref:Uncharacterized protein n=1 Tax=Rosa chinensis TaxID=74649 RepID=A0A2P6QRN1_ROSCH|nr:hypothetical protein RchiOBHm_Chr4g0395631 [Rosa chinensis]
MICSVRDNENFNKLFHKGSSSSACSVRPPHKSTKLNPGNCQPVVQEGLPRPRIITSSVAVSCVGSFIYLFSCAHVCLRVYS